MEGGNKTMSEVNLRHLVKIYPHAEKKKHRTTNLKVTERGVIAVDDFNLDIKDGEFIVLVGPSG